MVRTEPKWEKHPLQYTQIWKAHSPNCSNMVMTNLTWILSPWVGKFIFLHKGQPEEKQSFLSSLLMGASQLTLLKCGPKQQGISPVH